MKLKSITILSVLLLAGELQGAHLPHLIRTLSITKNRIDVEVHKALNEKCFRQNFFAEYNNDINLEALHPSIALIPFICSVITVVWVSNQDFYIEYLDKDLAKALENIKKSMKKMYPSQRWAGRLIPGTLIDNTSAQKEEAENKVAVLFSGGVDSVCTSFRHHTSPQLLITIWGSDVAPDDNLMWYGANKTCQEFAQSNNHDYTVVRSNFTGLFTPLLSQISAEIPRWWKFTSMGLSYCGLTAPILACKGYKKLLIASTYSHDFSYPYGSHPSIDDNLKFAGVKVTHDSFDINRQEKIAFIAHHSKKINNKPFLRPCWKNCPIGLNCEECLGKCLQTMNALLIEGENPQDYGFELTNDQIIERTQQKFLADRPSFTQGSTSRWQDMQNRIKVQLGNPEHVAHCSPKVLAHLKWLLTLNMEEYNAYKDVPFAKTM